MHHNHDQLKDPFSPEAVRMFWERARDIDDWTDLATTVLSRQLPPGNSSTEVRTLSQPTETPPVPSADYSQEVTTENVNPHLEPIRQSVTDAYATPDEPGAGK